MRFGSLRVRLFLAGTIAVTAALLLAALGLSVLFERHVERRVVDELSRDLDSVIAGLDIDGAGVLAMVRRPANQAFEVPTSGRYWQVVTEGQVLRSRSLWDDALSLPTPAGGAGVLREYRLTGPGSTELLAVERTVVLPPRMGALEARVVAALDRAEVIGASRQFRSDMLPYLVALALALLAANFVQVTIGLQPLNAVRARLSDIKAGRRNRLGADYPGEVQPLVDEVDSLLASSEHAVARARARASDLAHALRTPLQVLSGDAERLRQKGDIEASEGIAIVVATMQRVVDRELTRARIGETGQAQPVTPVGAAVDQIVSVVRRTPDGERLKWECSIPAGLSVRLNAASLAEAVGNVIENASRHARSRVAIEAWAEDAMVAISVRDDGQGIARERIDQVIQRGVRLDQGGSGAGLGLAIVAEIVETATGRLELANEPGGFVVTLHLPAAEPSIQK